MTAFILIVLGFVCGSFINALVWRLYEKDNKNISKKVNLSILNGRSVCPNCYHVLSVKDLLPVFSWIMLGGKCRYCKKPISIQYPLVELSSAFVFLFSYLYWPHNISGQYLFSFIVWLFVSIGLIALIVYDLRWMQLPNSLTFPLIGVVFIEIIIRSIFWPGGRVLLESSLWSVLIIFGLFYLIYWVSKGSWIGGGDVKLAILIGLLVADPILALLTIFFASIMGTLTSIPLLMSGKLKAKSLIPFGPYLIIATFIIVFFGAQIVSWYKGLLTL